MREILVLLSLAAAAFAQKQSALREPRPPNVLLITIDTLRARHLSCYGYAWKTSPNIDKLAAEGTRFERAYTTIPLTGPSHLSLFTSRYPQEHGARRNGEAIATDRTLVSLPQILRANDYRSAGFVSGWPLIGRLTHLDEWFDHYDEEMSRKYQLVNSSRWAEDVTPPAIHWLKQNGGQDRPFFLWVHYFDPHSPYDFREHFADLKPTGASKPAEYPDSELRERIRNYDTEIAYMDWYMGKLFATLDEMKLKDSTLVVLVADHGESLGEHDYVGHGRQLFEDIVRVPLIMRLPGKVHAGKVVKTPVSMLDIAPTIVDLTVGKQLARNRTPLTFVGRSLAPALIRSDRLSSRPLYFLTFAGKKGFAPKWLSWLWINNGDPPLKTGYLDGTHKWIWTPEDEQLDFFDVAKDPGEQNPRTVKEGDSAYAARVKRIDNWLSHTSTEASNQQLSEADLEVLRSLGYVQ